MSQTPLADKEQSPAPDRDISSALQQVEHALRGLQFGTVTVIVQDGVPIQVERTEKRRLRRTSTKGSKAS
jgi:hypothetical protein